MEKDKFKKWIDTQIKLGNIYYSTKNSRYGIKGALTGKWKSKYNGKVLDNRKGVNFRLTFEEYLYKAYEAGLTCPSQVTTKGDSSKIYNLGRYNDIGDYTIDNCRFITMADNIKERDTNKTNNLFELNKNKKPWLNCMANIDSKKVWADAEIIYEWWIKNNKKKSYTYLTKETKYKGRASRSILEKFKKGWIPTEDNEWLDWRKEFNENIML